MWQSLTINFFAISMLILIWQPVADQIGRHLRGREPLAWGLILGTAGTMSVLTAEPIPPGFYVDLRSATVACAAFIGGPFSALIAVAMTATARVWLGGAGLVPGLVSLTSVAVLALGVRCVTGSRPRTFPIMVGLSFATVVGFCTGYLTIPLETLRPIFAATFLPGASLNFIFTLILVALLHREIHRQQLIRENEIYALMVDLLPDSLNAKDLKGRFIAANPATARMMGCQSPKQLIGRRESDFGDPVGSSDVALVEDAAVRTGKVQTVEHEIVTEGADPVWVSSKKVPIMGPLGVVTGIISHDRDITEYHRLIQMKSEFISTVSHELRTPLTSVRGSLSMLSAMVGTALPANTATLLAIAHRNSERLVRLINDILDVEKLENGDLDFQFAMREIAPLIRDMLPSFDQYLPAQNVTVDFIDKAPGAIAEIDTVRFEQVLCNLVSNGIKFSDSGGRVIIRLARKEGNLVISVIDHGIGIPAAFHDRIFGRFEQVDSTDARRSGGTGLGLHISRVLVERMSGTIAFSSREGEGSIFAITLPDRSAIIPAADPAATTDPEAVIHRKRILYIEDDMSLHVLLKEGLGDNIDIEIDAVTTLADGEAAVRARSYDLLIVDDELPDGLGTTLIHEIPRDVPVIIFSALEVASDLPANVRHRFVKTRVDERDVVQVAREILLGAEPEFRDAG